MWGMWADGAWLIRRHIIQHHGALSQMQIEAFVVKAVAAWNVSPARKMQNFIQSSWEEQWHNIFLKNIIYINLLFKNIDLFNFSIDINVKNFLLLKKKLLNKYWANWWLTVFVRSSCCLNSSGTSRCSMREIDISEKKERARGRTFPLSTETCTWPSMPVSISSPSAISFLTLTCRQQQTQQIFGLTFWQPFQPLLSNCTRGKSAEKLRKNTEEKERG